MNVSMGDPFSAAGSVVGVISLGIQVTQSLVKFYQSYTGRNSELTGFIERLQELGGILQSVEKSLSNRQFQPSERDLVDRIETSIKNCNDSIQELQDECQKFYQNPSSGIKNTIKVVGRRATYPFRRGTLCNLDEDISDIRANLSFALDALQLNGSQRIKDDVTEMKIVLEHVRNSQISSDLRAWLKAHDAVVDHGSACAKKYPGTGAWFVRSLQFSRWLVEENSFLWLSGFAGSGKSVLCSTAIQSVLRDRKSNRGIGIAFFYFTFNDDSKQNESAMLRALVLQLSGQLHDGHVDLKRLHESYYNSIPPSSVLTEYLQRLIQKFRQVYIFLDALDESPRYGVRAHVLDTLDEIRHWGIQSLHLFISSRDEPDIRESLHFLTIQEVTMQHTGVNEDIAHFVCGQMSEDRRFQRLSPYLGIIQDTLARGANGVYVGSSPNVRGAGGYWLTLS